MEPLAHQRVAEDRRRGLLVEVERARRESRPGRAQPPVPRAVVLYPLLTCVALTMAGTLLALAVAMPLAGDGAGESAGQDEAVGRRFYAVIDEALATGAQRRHR